jgi:hypothetical protein
VSGDPETGTITGEQPTRPRESRASLAAGQGRREDAPNAPCSVLALISIPDELAAPPIAEETAKLARPVMKTRLRPVQE